MFVAPPTIALLLVSFAYFTKFNHFYHDFLHDRMIKNKGGPIMTEIINTTPQIGSKLRSKNILRLPEAISSASGIIINGRKIRSFVFTTDLAIIRNCDADISQYFVE